MKYCPFCGTKLDDDMVFCPACGKRFVIAKDANETETKKINFPTDSTASETPAELLPQKQKKASGKMDSKKKWLIGGIVLALAIIAGFYYAPYHYAIKGDFTTAEKLVISPSVYDQKVIDYIAAGRKMESGQYDDAEKTLSTLSGFLNADELNNETKYQKALQLAEENSYDTAVSIMQLLSESNYKDSAEQYNIIRYDEAHYYINVKNDTLTAYKRMKVLAESGYQNAQDELSELKEKLYSEMKNSYKSSDYQKVINISGVLEDFKDSEKYGLLASIKNENYYLTYQGKTYTQDQIAPVLLGMTNFEDAKKMLVYNMNIAEPYLKGTWKTKNGNFYFTIKNNGSSNFNIAWKDDGKKYYTIYKGDYISFNKTITEKGAVKQLKITPVSKKEIKIYSYRNKQTYTLYKQ